MGHRQTFGGDRYIHDLDCGACFRDLIKLTTFYSIKSL